MRGAGKVGLLPGDWLDADSGGREEFVESSFRLRGFESVSDAAGRVDASTTFVAEISGSPSLALQSACSMASSS
jgi:hypothetical protein